MVLTAAQTTSFFQDADQMGIPQATVTQLQVEGISTIPDLADFDKETLQQVADNLRKPGGRVPDPNPGAAAGATIPTPPFVFGAKSQHRLTVACELVRYYNTVGRDMTSGNMRWTHVMKNFEAQWKALKTRKDSDDPDVPKISKALPIIKWTEAFQDYLHRLIGVRTIPLAYVIRHEVDVPVVPPTQANNKPHSIVYGSIEVELVARASHDHELYREDNASVYYHLEEATRGTTYAASIKPYQRNKDGRGAWTALTSQYAGQDKWEAEIKRQDDLLHTRVWKGQNSFPLEGFIAQRRNAYVSMQQCADHVSYQLPNEHTRVGYLLEGIQCSDAGLQAAMASVRTDTDPDGMRNRFEKGAAHLLPYDPVAKKRAAATNNKRNAAQISSVEIDDTTVTAEASSTTAAKKQSIGKTGVHLRYHTPSEYDNLTDEQKDELREWRKANPSKKKNNQNDKKGKSNKSVKRQLASVVAKELKKFAKDGIEEDKETTDLQAQIASMVQNAVKEQLALPPAPPAAAPKKPSTLQSILKQAKFS